MGMLAPAPAFGSANSSVSNSDEKVDEKHDEKQLESSAPALFDCGFDNETCAAAVKAHPVYQAEALEAIKHAWGGYSEKGFGNDHVNTLTGGASEVWMDAGVTLAGRIGLDRLAPEFGVASGSAFFLICAARRRH